MNLLDRHIFKSVLFACTGAVVLFVFVLSLGNIIKDLLGHVLAGQLPLVPFLRLAWYWVPAMSIYALPIGILTGVLLTLGRLSADSEVTAMRASGISLVRIARPVIVLGLICAAAALYVNFQSAPHARVAYERELAEAVRSDPIGFIEPNTYITAFHGKVVYVGEKEGDAVRDIWLWELDSQSRVRRLVRAESGRIVYDAATQSLVPTLFNAKIEERDAADPEDFSKSPKAPTAGKLEEVHLSLRDYFSHDSVRLRQDWLTYSELQAERLRLAAQTPPPQDAEAAKKLARQRMALELVWQDKFNLSLAVFSFALIGVPLGIKISRRETSANLGLALLLVLSYYMLTVMVKWLDGHPEYRPDLLLWLPNLLFLTLGVWLFSRIDRK